MKRLLSLAASSNRLVLTAGFLALFLAAPAGAQWRMTTEAIVGIGHIPVVVEDLESAAIVWRDLGFNVAPEGTNDNGLTSSRIRFEDGAGIELTAVPATGDGSGAQYRALLDEAEGPVSFALHAPELNAVVDVLRGSSYDYQPVSHTLGRRGLEFIFFTWGAPSTDDRAYSRHPNGAKAMSRVWLAMPRSDGRRLRDMLGALGGELTSAKVYAPEAVQSYDVTLLNGEVLILPPSSELIEDRPVIGATFEVEDLDKLRERLDIFQVPWTTGGTEDMSVIVAPDATHGMWLEFRE